MIKYAKIINQETGLVEVGLGTNANFYQSLGMTLREVQQSDIDSNWYLSELCPMKTEEEKALEEKERIAKLYLTGADVERGIYQAINKDFEDIVEMVETLQFAEAPQVQGIDLKALKIELKANHFYRGNPYVNSVGALLGFTSEQLDKFFETNDYTCLLPINNIDDSIKAELTIDNITVSEGGDVLND